MSYQRLSEEWWPLAHGKAEHDTAGRWGCDQWTGKWAHRITATLTLGVHQYPYTAGTGHEKMHNLYTSSVTSISPMFAGI